MARRVLIVRTFPEPLDINSYNVQEIGLAKALTRRGMECGVVFFAGRQPERREEFRFVQDGRERTFAVYYLRGFSVYKNGFMPAVCRLLEQYDVVQVHEYDQIFSWLLYSHQKKPTVIYHGPYAAEYTKGYNLKCRIFDLMFSRRRRYGHVVALAKSRLAEQFLREKGFEKARTVGVGVDRDNFVSAPPKDGEAPCRLEPAPERFRLLYVGKIEERRNVYFLLRVFECLRRLHPRTQLIIVGDGEQEYREAFLRKLAPYLQSGDAIYFSKASQRELSQMYPLANAFVFTSNYEIFGMVLLEAMYFGLPVVSTLNGGSSTLIRNGRNGYICESFDTEQWTKVLSGLECDPALAARMGEQAHQTIEQGFLWDCLAPQFEAAYEEAEQEFQSFWRKGGRNQ